MALANEEANAQGEMQGALAAGIETLSRQQVVQFKKYTRKVLPLDGYVFWVASGKSVNVKGSLHYSSDLNQDADQTIGINRVLFTTQEEIAEFNEASPGTMYIGAHRGIKIAFSGRGQRAPEAALWHYFGNAIYPPLFSQIIDDPASLSGLEPIVSNSLPIWLALSAFGPIFPAYLVDPNLQPPYIVVDINSDSTEEWQAVPNYDSGWAIVNGSFDLGIPDNAASGFSFPTATQLSRDIVEFTLYGFTNTSALSFRSYVLQNSLNGDVWGVTAVTPMRDERRIQPEIAAIAMKKKFILEMNYLQSAVVQIAERLIASASIAFSARSS